MKKSGNMCWNPSINYVGYQVEDAKGKFLEIRFDIDAKGPHINLKIGKN